MFEPTLASYDFVICRIFSGGLEWRTYKKIARVTHLDPQGINSLLFHGEPSLKLADLETLPG